MQQRLIYTFRTNMALQIKQKWLNEHLHNVSYVPNVLKKHIEELPNDDKINDPWWLAEAIVCTAIEDDEAQTACMNVMQTIEQSVQEDCLMNNICDILQDVVELLTVALKTPFLKNAFNKDNALVTMYYVLVFVISCAVGDDRDDCEVIALVRKYEKTTLTVASMASKLLVNNTVYEFVIDKTHDCLSRGRLLC